MNYRITPLHLLAPLALIAATSGCGHETTQAAQEGSGLVIQNPTNERDYFVDFGEVPNGTKVKHTYQLLNTDSVPVTIQDMTPACSCTIPLISYRDESGEVVRGKRRGTPVITLPPGVTASLEVEIDTNHVKVKNVDKLSAVLVRCDSLNTPYLRFEMHLIANEHFQVTPTTINLGNIPVSSGKSGSSDIITALPGAQVGIEELLEATEGLDVTIAELSPMGETLWRVQVSLLPPLELGPFKGELRLQTSSFSEDGEGIPVLIPVTGQVVPDVVMFPTLLGLAAAEDGKGLTGQGNLDRTRSRPSNQDCRRTVAGQGTGRIDRALRGPITRRRRTKLEMECGGRGP